MTMSLLSRLNLERAVLIVLGLSFFVGIWHALPLTQVVGDENYFVGGVLRAMENHALIPQVNDVPYGTITYLLNYFLIGLALVFLWPFFGFNLGALKLALVENPELIYWIPRFLSALLGLVFLFLMNKALKAGIQDLKTRLAILIILFTNVITTVIMHTGKVWVLSALLVVISFYFLYKKNIALTIIFSFLALANFPLNAFSLINLPILWLLFRKDKESVRKIIKYTILGFLLFLLITALNFDGVRNQILSIYNGYLFSEEALHHNAGLFSALWLNLKKLAALFPLLIAAATLAAKNKIKNRYLFGISLCYLLIYFFVIVFLTRWAVDFQTALRYLFPIGFFITFFIASFDLKPNKAFYALSGISIIYFGLTIYYLASPTTYNLARAWILENLNRDNVIIVNRGLGAEINRGIEEVGLPLNRRSAILFEDKYCATQCRNVIEQGLNKDFLPLVIDPRSKIRSLEKITDLPQGAEVYYLDTLPQSGKNLTPIKEFRSEFTTGKRHYSVDYNLGNYFDIDFFRLNNLGKPVYIYK